MERQQATTHQQIHHPSGPPGRAVVRVLWLTFALNILGATLKLFVGLVSRNLTVLSDAMHGFLDASNNIVGLVAIKISWWPPDANHPYGHRKFEALASLAIGALMTLTSWEIVRAIARRLFYHERIAPPDDSLVYIGAVLTGLVINIFVSRYEARRGRELKSSFLLADAAHTKTDIFVTFVSLSSLLIAPRHPVMDSLLSIIIVLFILHTGWSVVRDNVGMLTDAAVMDPGPIKNVAETIEGVENAHAIRTHGMPDEVHLDMHIVVRPELTAAETHSIEARVRAALLTAFPDIAEVNIHHQTQMPVTERPFTRQTAPKPHPEPQ